MLPSTRAGARTRILVAALLLMALNGVMIAGGIAPPAVPSGPGADRSGSAAPRTPPGFSADALALVREATATSPKPYGYGSDVVHRRAAARAGGRPVAPPPPGGDEADLLAPFRGLSTWVDLYDTALAPELQAELAAAAGVDVIFAQTAFASTLAGLHDPGRLHRLIEAAHDRGLQVMVWTIPDFVDVELDFKRAQAAISLVTPRGDRPDGFGLDVELPTVSDVAERTRRLLDLSSRIRGWVGEGYPMAAVVLPPLQLRLNTTWWPDFPYRALSEQFDVMIPMSYSSYRGTDAFTTLVWNRDNVTIVRQLIGDMAFPVHLAGGIADDLPEVGAFVDAVQTSGAIGGGLYDLHTTPPESWAQLRRLSLRLPAQPLQTPAR